MNLCVNAADAMPEGGILTLRTRQLGQDWVLWEVADNGEGMPAEVAKRALEPFFTTKPQGKGTGLGLAMVHGVVKAHGGTLQIESAPGAGTTVRMRLPAQAERAERPMAITAPEPGGVGPLRILLVDDDELIRASMPSMLSLSGHSTVTADSGRAALALLAQGLKVDLAILDLNMPEMGGLETLNWLRVLRPHLPVLIASGYVDAPHLEVLGRHLMLQTLGKPFAMTELRARLQSLFPEGAP
jgi:CheY-like chemotaxis protein